MELAGGNTRPPPGTFSCLIKWSPTSSSHSPIAECAWHHGHNPEAYLADVLKRLPCMTNQDDLSALLPSRWKPATAAGPVLDVEATVCLS